MKELLRNILIVWGYCRTSGKVNGEDSIPNQRMQINEFSDTEGYVIRGFLEDEAKSAFKGHRREGFETLLLLINQGKVDVVVVTFFNRLARKAEEMLDILLLLKSKNIECISVGQGKRLSRMGHNEIAIEAIMAEEEDKNLTRRIYNSKAISISRGEYLTKPALGYIRNEKRHLEIVGYEATVVKSIFNYYIKGTSTKQIAMLLNTTQAAGRKWSGHTVEEVLTNPVYTGKHIRRNIQEDGTVEFEKLSSGEHEPIIDEKTFYMIVEEINEKRRRIEKRKYKKHHHLFKGIICCPRCYKIMRASPLYYTCPNENCAFSSIRKDRIESHLLEFVKSLDRRPDINSVRQRIHKYTTQINRLWLDMDRLKQQFAINKINQKTFSEEMFKKGQDIKKVQEKIDYGVYQSDDTTYTELIDHQKMEELSDLMLRRKLILTFTQEGNHYKIEKL